MDNRAEPKTIQQKREQAQKAFEEATNELRRCFDIVLRTEEGLRVFQFLYRLFGADREIVRMTDQHKVDVYQTVILADRHDLYTQIKRFISTDKIIEIEKKDWEK